MVTPIDRTGWLLMERVPERYAQVMESTALAFVFRDVPLAEILNSAEIWPVSGDMVRTVLEYSQIKN